MSLSIMGRWARSSRHFASTALIYVSILHQPVSNLGKSLCTLWANRKWSLTESVHTIRLLVRPIHWRNTAKGRNLLRWMFQYDIRWMSVANAWVTYYPGQPTQYTRNTMTKHSQKKLQGINTSCELSNEKQVNHETGIN